MLDIRRIIVPVDFYQYSNDLAEFAIGIANKLEADVTFVHVAEYILSYSDYSPEPDKRLDEAIGIYAESKMETLVEKSKKTCPGCKGVVLRGVVSDGIVQYARENEVDMIIMATHGAKGIEKILMGSVADRVLKQSPCPVLIFNPYKGERGFQSDSSMKKSAQPA